MDLMKLDKIVDQATRGSGTNEREKAPDRGVKRGWRKGLPDNYDKR